MSATTAHPHPLLRSARAHLHPRPPVRRRRPRRTWQEHALAVGVAHVVTFGAALALWAGLRFAERIP